MRRTPSPVPSRPQYPLNHSHSSQTVGANDQLREIRASLNPLQKPTPLPDSNGQMQLKTRAALEEIRQSLQPYETQLPYEAPSETGTPTGPESLQTSLMLQQLVAMGFDKEASWYALKLTQFRGIENAVEILVKAKSQHVFSKHNGDFAKGNVWKQTYDNGTESGSSRSESPGLLWSQLRSGAPSPMTFPAPGPSKRSQASVCLQPPVMGSSPDYSLQQSSPVLHAVARSKRVEKPVAQSAVSPTVINVASSPVSSTKNSPGSAKDYSLHPQQTRVLSARLDSDSVSTVRINVHPSQTPDGASCLQYRFEANSRNGEPVVSMQARGDPPSPAAGIQRIAIDDGLLDPYCPDDKRYIEDLCRRVSDLLSHQSPLGKRDSTASSASESSLGGERPFLSLLSVQGRNSPVSSVSTESSTEGSQFAGVVRSESPLPETVSRKIASGQYDPIMKPCAPKAFKFFMEQHVENVIKQHRERQMRYLQLEKEMANANLANFRTPMKRLLADKESRYLRLRRQRMERSMFEKLQTIGVGAFGEVALVRKTDTKALYAMKTLRKSDVIKQKQAAHVKAERDILSEADNEWVVKLYYSFQDRENLFFIMEFIPGGDMMNLLIKKEIFEEDLARFYIAELVCAIESVHKLGFLHRDIKPDNIVIDRNGHIKLTDFGLCTGLRWTHDNKYYGPDQSLASASPGHESQDSFDFVNKIQPLAKVLHHRNQRQRQKAHSLVGTPNYIAPEVLNRSGHTHLCDWWSVGVILYEMVVGYPPFQANTPRETQEKVINWRRTLAIPEREDLAPATKDLILKLCRGPEDRLGLRGGAAEIKPHPFFQGLEFSRLRSMKAPYIPPIRFEGDTANFDPVEPREETEAGRWHGAHDDHAFYEFTFRRFFDSDPMGCPTIRRSPSRPPLSTLMESPVPTSSATHIAQSSNISILRINTGAGQEPGWESRPEEHAPGRPDSTVYV